MMDIILDAPEVHFLGLNQRLYSGLHSRTAPSYPRGHCYTPKVITVLLPSPESHSP